MVSATTLDALSLRDAIVSTVLHRFWIERASVEGSRLSYPRLCGAAEKPLPPQVRRASDGKEQLDNDRGFGNGTERGASV
jgi:hypothetical protein